MAIMAYCVKCNTEYSLKKHEEGCPNCKMPLKSCKRFRVNVSAPNRKRLTRTVNGNLTLARRVEAKFKTEIGDLKYLGIHKAPLMSEVWEKYEIWAKKNKKSSRDDISRWKYHVERHVEGLRMDQIYAKDVQAILNNMVKYKSGFFKKTSVEGEKEKTVIERVELDEGMSHAPATIKHVLVLIKRVYNWAILQQLYFGQNPAVNVQASKVDNAKTECLDKSQVDKLLAVIETWRNRRAALVVKFALYTGLRLDEIIGLEWKDIDLEKGCVTLPDPKGKQATLPISSKAIGILKDAEDILPFPESPYAFPNKSGERRVSFNKIWSRIRDKAGIPKGFRFHDLRHTFASYLASSGEVDLYTLQKLLNHQTAQMTQRYAHLSDKALRRGANVADKVFGNGNGSDGSSQESQADP
jgi:integrase